VNTYAPWPDLYEAEARVLNIQDLSMPGAIFAPASTRAVSPLHLPGRRNLIRERDSTGEVSPTRVGQGKARVSRGIC
jgi:hypothetical protein